MCVFCGVEKSFFSVSFLPCNKTVDFEQSLQLIGAGGYNGGRFYGNCHEMLAEAQRCVVVSTSCSPLHPPLQL